LLSDIFPTGCRGALTAGVTTGSNATVVTLDQAPQGYQDFDKGAARKFVIDPHRIVAKMA
jgi:glutathione-independent formaldehyde dehydrogenase